MKKVLKTICISFAIVFAVVSCRNGKECDDGVIKTDTPSRPVGQESMIGYADKPIDTIRVGIVGLGSRGSSAVYRYTHVPWTKIVALCDVEPDRVEKSVDLLKEKGVLAPAEYTGETGYKKLCARSDIDLVYVCTDWEHHVPVALEAMSMGKHVAIEVPSATTLEDCWSLVDVSEKYRRHCVILENCCYDFFELNALQMARSGVLGDVVHVEGSYNHDLYDYWNGYWNDWRLKYNSTHKGDIYPTHGLGPVAQVLGINRGDRFKRLSAYATASFNGRKTLKEFRGVDASDFQNGDVTCTLLSTEKGKTALIEHDVLTPRPYDRMYQLVGTLGYIAKYPIEEINIRQSALDSIRVGYMIENQHAALPADIAERVKAMFPNPILNEELTEKAKMVGGHGGMDWIMDYRLAYCLHYGLPVDMDVYDLASWCCISELGAISIENGNAPVEVPDFTRGDWQKRGGFKYAFADGVYR